MADGVRLRLHALVSVDGDAGAPAVVLLPGLVTAGRSMVPLARALVRRGLRVWPLHPPGFGYSDKPQRSLSIIEQAGIVAEWLRAVPCAPGAPARVLGNSSGSQVVAALATARPDVVERVVLLPRSSNPGSGGGCPGCGCCPVGLAPGSGGPGGGGCGCSPGCTRCWATSHPTGC